MCSLRARKKTSDRLGRAIPCTHYMPHDVSAQPTKSHEPSDAPSSGKYHAHTHGRRIGRCTSPIVCKSLGDEICRYQKRCGEFEPRIPVSSLSICIPQGYPATQKPQARKAKTKERLQARYNDSLRKNKENPRYYLLIYDLGKSFQASPPIAMSIANMRWNRHSLATEPSGPVHFSRWSPRCRYSKPCGLASPTRRRRSAAWAAAAARRLARSTDIACSRRSRCHRPVLAVLLNVSFFAAVLAFRGLAR